MKLTTILSLSCIGAIVWNLSILCGRRSNTKTNHISIDSQLLQRSRVDTSTTYKESNSNMTEWKIFLDLQCPYSKVFWKQLPSIQEKFGNKYTFTRHITSLVFHPQAFDAQCAVTLVGNIRGLDIRRQYEDTLFEHQELYMNAALGDARKTEIIEVFANIAEKVDGLFNEEFTRDVFVEKIHDWNMAVKPAYNEHKIALGYKVYGTPKHVINERLLEDTESSWGVDEWVKKLEKEGL